MLPGPFFPRGSGPLVSILMATRGRAAHLVSALDSLINLAVDPSQIEVVFKLDEDDRPTLEAVGGWVKNYPSLRTTALVTPRGRGYAEMGNWTNQMAGAAKGDWLFIFNDDATMLTEKWDRYLLGAVLPNCWHFSPEDVTMLTPQTNDMVDSTEFYIVRRRQYELLNGRITSSCYIDSWLCAVLGRLYSQVRFPLIKIKHHRETVRDEIRVGTDSAFQENLPTLEGASAILGQTSDSLNLLAHVERKLASVPPQADPTAGPGWYYWKQSPTSAPHHLAVTSERQALWFQGLFLEGPCSAHKSWLMGGQWWPRLVRANF